MFASLLYIINTAISGQYMCYCTNARIDSLNNIDNVKMQCMSQAKRHLCSSTHKSIYCVCDNNNVATKQQFGPHTPDDLTVINVSWLSVEQCPRYQY